MSHVDKKAEPLLSRPTPFPSSPSCVESIIPKTSISMTDDFVLDDTMEDASRNPFTSSNTTPTLSEVSPLESRCFWKSDLPHLLDPDYFISMGYFTDSVQEPGRCHHVLSSLGTHKVSYLDSKYRITESLGRGSFSDVFKVRRNIDDAYFALKCTREAFTGLSDRLRKLYEVAHMWLLTTSPHCVQIVESWEQTGRLYIVMELCENGSLQDIIHFMSKNDVKFTEYQIWQILRQISLGLENIHRRGIVHLDIKPANIFIDGQGSLKIGDFGLSVRVGSQHDLDMEGDKYYMAPETLEGLYHKPADVFSLGLLALELATDVELPSQGTSWQNLRHGDYSELDFNDVSDALGHLIREMTDPDPFQRPAIEEILRRIDTYSERFLA